MFEGIKWNFVCLLTENLIVPADDITLHIKLSGKHFRLMDIKLHLLIQVIFKNLYFLPCRKFTQQLLYFKPFLQTKKCLHFWLDLFNLWPEVSEIRINFSVLLIFFIHKFRYFCVMFIAISPITEKLAILIYFCVDLFQAVTKACSGSVAHKFLINFIDIHLEWLSIFLHLCFGGWGLIQFFAALLEEFYFFGYIC